MGTWRRSGEADPCVYIRTESTMTILAVYVDDLIIITKTRDEMDEVKENLEDKFKTKDMGKLHYCLGINVVQDENGIWMHQKQYILNMLG